MWKGRLYPCEWAWDVSLDWPMLSQRSENQHAIALHYMYYNFVRIHKSLRSTPAVAVGVTSNLWDIQVIAALLAEPEARKRGSYKKIDTKWLKTKTNEKRDDNRFGLLSWSLRPFSSFSGNHLVTIFSICFCFWFLSFREFFLRYGRILISIKSVFKLTHCPRLAWKSHRQVV